MTGEGSQFGPPPYGFSKNTSPIERVKLWLFVTFNINIMISPIFPESFIVIPQVIQEICKISLSIFTFFMNFHHVFYFFIF